jgi:hypothetical protein
LPESKKKDPRSVPERTGRSGLYKNREVSAGVAVVAAVHGERSQ